MSTSLDRLHDAVAAVLDLHQRQTYTDTGGSYEACDHCWTGNPWCTTSASWPCPTVEAIGKQVDVDRVRRGGL